MLQRMMWVNELSIFHHRTFLYIIDVFFKPIVQSHLDYFQVIIHNIRLPKQSTVGDVINELKTKVSMFFWEKFQKDSFCVVMNY